MVYIYYHYKSFLLLLHCPYLTAIGTRYFEDFTHKTYGQFIEALLKIKLPKQ